MSEAEKVAYLAARFYEAHRRRAMERGYAFKYAPWAECLPVDRALHIEEAQIVLSSLEECVAEGIYEAKRRRSASQKYPAFYPPWAEWVDAGRENYRDKAREVLLAIAALAATDAGPEPGFAEEQALNGSE